MHFIQLLTDMSLMSFHAVEAFTMDEHKRCLFTQINKQMQTHTHKQPSINWKKPQQKAINKSTNIFHQKFYDHFILSFF